MQHTSDGIRDVGQHQAGITQQEPMRSSSNPWSEEQNLKHRKYAASTTSANVVGNHQARTRERSQQVLLAKQKTQNNKQHSNKTVHMEPHQLRKSHDAETQYAEHNTDGD